MLKDPATATFCAPYTIGDLIRQQMGCGLCAQPGITELAKLSSEELDNYFIQLEQDEDEFDYDYGWGD